MDIKLLTAILVVYILMSFGMTFIVYCVWMELRGISGKKRPTKTKRDYI